MKAMSKQTAVEWLEIQLFKKQGKFNKSDIEQAKAMEKVQIENARNEGYVQGYMRLAKLIEEATQRNLNL